MPKNFSKNCTPKSEFKIMSLEFSKFLKLKLPKIVKYQEFLEEVQL